MKCAIAFEHMLSQFHATAVTATEASYFKFGFDLNQTKSINMKLILKCVYFDRVEICNAHVTKQRAQPLKSGWIRSNDKLTCWKKVSTSVIGSHRIAAHNM